MWGDVPSWIAVALDVLIPLSAVIFGLTKRNAIGAWLNRILNRTPPPPVRPVWEFSRAGRNVVRISNAAQVNAAYPDPVAPQQIRVESNDADVFLTGAAWAEFPVGTSQEFIYEAR